MEQTRNVAVNRETGKVKEIIETHNGFVIFDDEKEIHTSSYGFHQDYKIRSTIELTTDQNER